MTKHRLEGTSVRSTLDLERRVIEALARLRRASARAAPKPLRVGKRNGD
jgi:hypothetical protein